MNEINYKLTKQTKSNMKKRFTFLIAALGLLMMIGLPIKVVAENYNYDFSSGGSHNSESPKTNTWTTSYFTILQEKGSGNDVVNYLTDPRWYKDNEITITPKENITITQIVINCTSNKYTGQTIAASTGSVSENDNNSTWTGSITSSTPLTLTMGSQCRPSSLNVTYSSSGGTLTCATPMFSLTTGIYYGAQEVTINCGTDGATIYYTTDGTTPTTSSTTYSAPLNISATTTVKAMAAKAGYENSEVATAIYTINDPISGYSIDFEAPSKAYTDWTFINMESQQTGNANITAHGGTYYGTTGGKATASIQTKEKVANPGTLTCYVSKQSDNTSSSTWYIQVSSDGSDWTDVETYDAASMKKGEWKEFTANLSSHSNVFVRIYYSGSTAVRNIDDLELTMASPTVTASVESISDFLYAYGSGPSTAQSFTVSGEYLSGNLVVTASSNYEVCKTQDGECTSSVEFTPSTGTVSAETVYVRLKAGLSIGYYNTVDDKITLTSTGATNKTIALSGTVSPAYTITYSATNGSISGVDAESNPVASGASIAQGATVTLTATPASEAYRFSSWSDGAGNTTLSSTTDNPTTFTMGNAAVTVTATFVARTPVAVTLHHGASGGTSTIVNTYTDATLGDVIDGQTPGTVNGWTAIGWVTSYSSGYPVLVTESTTVGEITDLYAVYRQGNNEKYELTDDVSDLVAGTRYMIGTTGYKLMTTNFAGTSNVSLDGNNQYEYSEGTQWLLWGATDVWTFTDATGNYLSSQTTSGNSASLTAETTPTDYSYWSISYDSEDPKHSLIQNNGNYTNNSKTLNISFHNSYFNCYNNKVVYLFKEVSVYSTTPAVELCHVTYDGNGSDGGSAPVDNNEYNVNDEVTVLANTFTKTGYYFVLWSDMVNGEDQNANLFEAGDKFNITANTTLYAQWSINSYSYKLTDDAHSIAELEVDGSSAGATIQYNKEVTVNVVADAGYIYHISVTNDATSEAVPVTDDKFMMPASPVTVTVTSELDPYQYATLSSSDISNMENAGSNYATIKYITLDGLYWEAKAYNTDGDKTYLQVNTGGSGNASGSYVKLPEFNGKIEQITITVNSSNRYLYFNTTNSTENPIATGGDGTASTTKTIDMTNVCYQTGYIVSSGSIQITNIEVKYRPYENMTGTELTSIEDDRAISIPSSTAATATNLTIPASSGLIIKTGASLTVSGTLTNSGTAANLIIEDGGQLICNNSVAATVKKTIANAGAKDAKDHWYTISSPVHTGDNAYVTIGNETTVNLTADSYDMFAYDEANAQWLNQKSGSGAEGFSIMNAGQGYMYRNSGNELSFVGNTNADYVTYTLTRNNAGNLAGWNLIGNPYPHNIYKGAGTAIVNSGDYVLATGFYTLSNEGAWTPCTDNTTAIAPGQGLLVKATTAGTLTMTNTAAKNSSKANQDNIQFLIGNSQYEDVAYAWFDKEIGLEKINHRNADIPMLYIPQDGQDYAIATMSDDTKVFGLNFKAGTMGQYTLSYKATGEYNYLHVIDRLTGEDVDMLMDGKYTFMASPSDNDERFIVKLEYMPDYGEGDSEIFAYQTGTEVLVSGEGELQIFDVTGRRVINRTIMGAEAIMVPSQGVYIFRLVGSEVKTQKIVVR